MILLKPLTPVDAAAIRRWPPYPERFKLLDYALREGGWLDEYPESSTTRRFAAWEDDKLVGFSLLTDIQNGQGEFYIAVQPELISRGIGRILMEQTIAFGFEKLALKRIYLKVRDWHQQGISLYESLGFRKCGTSVADIHGKPVHFVTMELRRDWRNG
jgi:RimJ/RimL family protein N-acetyltransferase